jgi:hypothetical protein
VKVSQICYEHGSVPLWPSLYKSKTFRLLKSTALPMSAQPNISDSFLRRIEIHQRLSPNIILQYDATSRDLQVWFWYVYIRLFDNIWLKLTLSGGPLLRQEVAFFHPTCCTTASITISGLRVASALAKLAASVLRSRQYTRRRIPTFLVNM